jgi:hypothetical protein
MSLRHLMHGRITRNSPRCVLTQNVLPRAEGEARAAGGGGLTVPQVPPLPRGSASPGSTRTSELPELPELPELGRSSDLTFAPLAIGQGAKGRHLACGALRYFFPREDVLGNIARGLVL